LWTLFSSYWMERDNFIKKIFLSKRPKIWGSKNKFIKMALIVTFTRTRRFGVWTTIFRLCFYHWTSTTSGIYTPHFVNI
jgi:hypothetical protein